MPRSPGLARPPPLTRVSVGLDLADRLGRAHARQRDRPHHERDRRSDEEDSSEEEDDHGRTSSDLDVDDFSDDERPGDDHERRDQKQKPPGVFV